MKTKIFTALILLVLFSTTVLGAGENLRPETAIESGESEAEIRDAGFLGFSFLSFVRTQDVFRPGETGEVQVEVDFTEEYTDNAYRVVEFYRCADSGCDDGSQDEFLYAASEEKFYQVQVGDTETWVVDWIGDDQESYYAAVAYIYNRDTGNLISDTPRKIFEVREETDDAPTADVSVPSTSNPGQQITIDASGSSDDNGITEYTYKIDGNVEARTSSSSIEVQFDSAGDRTITVTVEDTAGQTDSASTTITVEETDSDGDGVPDTDDDCPNTFGEGSDGCPLEADVSLQSTPSFTVDESSNSVKGTLSIQNTGSAAMPDGDIVEMQVRPFGEGPLSFAGFSFVGSQDTCDPDFPNNVHKGYKIDADRSVDITLNAGTDLKDGETYEVFFLTREKCGGDKTEPIYNSYNAGAFTFESDVETTNETNDTTQTTEEPNVVEVSKPKVSVDNQTVTTEVSFKNDGGAMGQSRIVEMQIRPKGTNPLAFSDTLETCDSDHPENVHKSFKLGAGETASTKLTAKAPEPGKDYTVYLLTRGECGGEKVEPYVNSDQAADVSIQSIGSRSGSSVKTISPGLPAVAIAAGGLGAIIGLVFLLA